MGHFEWKPLLEELSGLVLSNDLRNFEENGCYQVPEKYHRRGYLGSRGATSEQIEALEQRLGGIQLPVSYREFLAASNGWGHMGAAMPGELWPVNKIQWLRVRNQRLIEEWGNELDNDCTPEEHLASQRKDTVRYRGAYMKNALEISGSGDASLLFLSPDVVAPDGEWECWQYASWYPGMARDASFQAWMKKKLEFARQQAVRQKPLG